MSSQPLRNKLAERLKERKRIPLRMHIPRRSAAVADGFYRILAAGRHDGIEIQTVCVRSQHIAADAEPGMDELFIGICKLADCHNPTFIQLFLCTRADEKKLLHRKNPDLFAEILLRYHGCSVRLFHIRTELCKGLIEAHAH